MYNHAVIRLGFARPEGVRTGLGFPARSGSPAQRRRVWVFVMTLGWSRACCVELVRTADTAAFIQRHVNAFEHLGGAPRRHLYDNAKVITLRWDEEMLAGEGAIDFHDLIQERNGHK